jgi:hypothetical protein
VKESRGRPGRKRVLQKDAADPRVEIDRGAAVVLDPAAHLVEGRDSVLLLEGLPREGVGEEGEVEEEAPADDVVLRGVELEEQRIAR